MRGRSPGAFGVMRATTNGQTARRIEDMKVTFPRWTPVPGAACQRTVHLPHTNWENARSKAGLHHLVRLRKAKGAFKTSILCVDSRLLVARMVRKGTWGRQCSKVLGAIAPGAARGEGNECPVLPRNARRRYLHAPKCPRHLRIPWGPLVQMTSLPHAHG